MNKTPLSCLKYASPYENLHVKKPCLTHLRDFGCLKSASLIKAHIAKFDSRAIPRVLLGYPTGQRSYKLLNLETSKIFVSMDVIFHAKHLSFHISQSTTSSPIFLPANTQLDLYG